MRPDNYFVFFHPDNIYSTDNIYYRVRLGHILNIYLRNFFSKVEKIIKKNQNLWKTGPQRLGDLQGRMDNSLEKETSSNINSHFHVKCSLLIVMVVFIKKALSLNPFF